MNTQKSFSTRKLKSTSKKMTRHFIGDDGLFYTIKNGDLNSVSKKTYLAYLKQEGLKFSDIKKLLNSAYPYQSRNYNLLKIPSRYIPVDYKLTNLVKTLWKHGIETEGWDQGLFSSKRNREHPGFITFECRSNHQELSLSILQKLFGSKNIKDVSKYFQNVKSGQEKREMKMKIAAKYPKQIRFRTEHGYCVMSFNHQLLDWIHQKLKIEIPKIEDSHLGGQIECIEMLKERLQRKKSASKKSSIKK